MASGPLRKEVVPLSGQALASLGDTKAAVKATRQEVSALRKELLAASREGRSVEQIQQRLERAVVRQDALAKQAATQQANRQRRGLVMGATTATTALFTASALRDIVKGELRGETLLWAMSSGESIARLAKYLGASQAFVDKLTAAAPVLSAVGQAVAVAIQAYREGKRQQQAMKSLSGAYARGEMTAGQFERMRDRYESWDWGLFSEGYDAQVKKEMELTRAASGVARQAMADPSAGIRSVAERYNLQKPLAEYMRKRRDLSYRLGRNLLPQEDSALLDEVLDKFMTEGLARHNQLLARRQMEIMSETQGYDRLAGEAFIRRAMTPEEAAIMAQKPLNGDELKAALEAAGESAKIKAVADASPTGSARYRSQMAAVKELAHVQAQQRQAQESAAATGAGPVPATEPAARELVGAPAAAAKDFDYDADRWAGYRQRFGVADDRVED